MSPERFLNAQLTQIAIVGLAVLGLALFLSSGVIFGDVNGRPEQSAQLSELKAQHAKWEQRKPAAYAFRVQRQCFCAPDVTVPYVVYVNGTVTRFEKSPDSAEHYAGVSLPSKELVTIDGAFDLVRNALKKANQVEIEYDDRYGYPTRISDPGRVLDGHSTLILSDFRLLSDNS